MIDRIHILNPIEYTNIRRNEVSEKVPRDVISRAERGDAVYLASNDVRQQRAAMVLKNVDYVIEAHFERVTEKAGPDDTDEKHYNMVLRRLRKGQHYHQPCLGTREFPARVELIEDGVIPPSQLRGERDLGWMLYDMCHDTSADKGGHVHTCTEECHPSFFRAQLYNGKIDLREVEVRS